MDSKQRDVELLLLGTLLIKPESSKDVQEMQDKDLDVLLQAIKAKDGKKVSEWMVSNQVYVKPGNGGSAAALQRAQRRNIREYKLKRLSVELHHATGLKMAQRVVAIIKELEALRLEGEQDAETFKANEADGLQAKAAEGKAGDRPTPAARQGNPKEASKAATQPKPV
jgi:hypothetical protein